MALKLYLVRLDDLPASQRQSALDLLKQSSWEVFDAAEPLFPHSVKVAWTSPENFVSSPCFPKGCRCIDLNG